MVEFRVELRDQFLVSFWFSLVWGVGLSVQFRGRFKVEGLG